MKMLVTDRPRWDCICEGSHCDHPWGGIPIIMKSCEKLSQFSELRIVLVLWTSYEFCVESPDCVQLSSGCS